MAPKGQSFLELGFPPLESGEMALRRAGKRPSREDEEEEVMEMVQPLVFLSSSSSSDDEEANLDLSLEIVERAKRKQEETRGNKKRVSSLEPPGARVPAVIDLSSSSDEAEAVSESRDGGESGETPPAEDAAAVEGSKRKGKRRKKKQKKEADDEGAVEGGSEPVKDDVGVLSNEEEITGIAGSIAMETDGGVSDNIVFRKLLRGPRYFDPGNSRWESCYNCGEEGHVAADCTAEKRKKPCFVCGAFGHNANKCSQGHECFICKQRGHLARDCPDKRRTTPQGNKLCIRCGDMGHDMASCVNTYPPDDLKMIRCYVCEGFGHLCCVDFIPTAPREISCYNCGDSGHSGAGCAKRRGESGGVVSPTLCYICGEEGHFARGCTNKFKFGRRHGEPSTSTPKSTKNRTAPRHSKDRRDFWGSKSREFGTGSKSLPDKVYKKKNMHYEGRRNTIAGKSRIKGGWIVDDPGDFPRREPGSNPWKSPKNKSWKSPSTPRTPVRNYKHYSAAGSSHRYRAH